MSTFVLQNCALSLLLRACVKGVLTQQDPILPPVPNGAMTTAQADLGGAGGVHQ